MIAFKTIRARAETRKGGAEALAKLMPPKPDPKALHKLRDERVLAEMARRVFSAGFAWSVIETKWPGFEEAFLGFEPSRLTFEPDEFWHKLTMDARIVRNGAKIQATIANARFLVDTAKAHGSFGAFLRNWPPSDQIGLMEHLKQNAARLGGSSAMYFLRFNGWDAFILSADVVRALIREGVVDKLPTSKADLRAVQDAFNAWTKESGRPQHEVSRILALSAGPS